MTEDNAAVSVARVMEQAHRNNRREKLHTTPKLLGALPSEKTLFQKEGGLDGGSLDHLDGECDGTHNESKGSDGEMQAFEAPRHSKLMATIRGDNKMKGLYGARRSCLERKHLGHAQENYRHQLVYPETGRFDDTENRELCSPANEAAFVKNDDSDESAGALLAAGETTPSPLPSPPVPWKPTARPKVETFSQQSASLMHQSSLGPLQSSAKHLQTEDRSTNTKQRTDAATQLSTDEGLNYRSDFHRGMAIAPESTERQQQSLCQTSERVSSQSYPALLDDPPPVQCGTSLRDRVEHVVAVSPPAASEASPDFPQHCPCPPASIGTLSPDGSTRPTSVGDECSMKVSLQIGRIPRSGRTVESQSWQVLCSGVDRQRCSSRKINRTSPTESKTCEDWTRVDSVDGKFPCCKVTYSGEGADMRGTNLASHSEDPPLSADTNSVKAGPLLVEALGSTDSQSSPAHVSKRTGGEVSSPTTICGSGGQWINKHQEGIPRPKARYPGHEKSDIVSGVYGDRVP